MKSNGLKELFLDELRDMYSSEKQILLSLPTLIELASSLDLKEGLQNHLQETNLQVTRIEKIFSILGVKAIEKTCEAMEGLIRESEDLVEGKSPSPLLDAAIISACQKIEHYEIASYGTLKSFAKTLEFNKEIIDLIKETEEEEVGADKKLTKVAEGSIFTTGVNAEAANRTAKR